MNIVFSRTSWASCSSARPARRPQLSTPLLQRALVVVAARLPASEEQVMQRLRKAGLTRGSVDLGRIERAARFSDAPVAFAVLRREGLTLAVQPERLRLASLTYALAVRQVVSFGLALLRRIGFLARTEDLNFVRAVLTAKDTFEWLDRRVGWFRFGNGSSQLVRTIESILTVAGPVPLKELAHVLFRRWAPDNAPSGRTLRALCSQIPSLRLDGNMVALSNQGAPADLARAGAHGAEAVRELRPADRGSPAARDRAADGSGGRAAGAAVAGLAVRGRAPSGRFSAHRPLKARQIRRR